MSLPRFRVGLRRGLLIAFSGVDGSGKSTQVELLRKRLKELDVETERVWCRWRPITSLPLLGLLRRLGYAQIHDTSSIGFVETNLPSRGGLSFLWRLLTQFDAFVKTGVMVALPLLRGKVVICDRYILDLMVEEIADSRGHADKGSRLSLLEFLPRPQESFLVLVDPEVAFARKPDLPTLSHFAARTKLYSQLASPLGVAVIDGSMTPERIHSEIWNRISNRFEHDKTEETS